MEYIFGMFSDWSVLLQLFPLFFWMVWIHSHQFWLGSDIWLKEWRIQGLRHEAVTPECLYATEHFHLLTYDFSQKTYGRPRMPVQVSKCRWVLKFNIHQPNTLNNKKSKMSSRPKSCSFPTDFCISGHAKEISTSLGAHRYNSATTPLKIWEGTGLVF